MVIVVAVVVTVAAAGAYLYTKKPSYQSTATVQLSPAQTQVQQGAAVTVDTSLSTVTSATVRAAAAKILAAHHQSAGGSSVSASEGASSTGTATGTISITATAPHPGDTKAVANAYADAYVKELTGQVQGQVAALNQQATEAQGKISNLEQQTAAHPTNQVLAIQLNAAKTTYAGLLGELSTATASGAPASVTTAASYGTLVGSSKAKILALAVLVGLLAGAGIALVRDQFDTRLRLADDLEGSASAPLLAELPRHPDDDRPEQELPVVGQARSPFAEAVRELRTAAQVMVGTNPCPVLVVTSPEPLDGKTYIAANLAASWALSGKRVIIVSGDLRRSRLDRVFGSSDADRGLASLVLEAPTPAPAAAAAAAANGAWELSELTISPDKVRHMPSHKDVLDLLQPTPIEGLQILPAGPSPNDPADVLADPTMAHIFDHLRELADVVIVDSPPVLAVADAAILGTYSDGVIVIATALKTTKGQLEQAVKRLQAARTNVLGAALNCSKEVIKDSYQAYYEVS